MFKLLIVERSDLRYCTVYSCGCLVDIRYAAVGIELHLFRAGNASESTAARQRTVMVDEPCLSEKIHYRHVVGV